MKTKLALLLTWASIFVFIMYMFSNNYGGRYLIFLLGSSFSSSCIGRNQHLQDVFDGRIITTPKSIITCLLLPAGKHPHSVMLL